MLNIFKIFFFLGILGLIYAGYILMQSNKDKYLFEEAESFSSDILTGNVELQYDLMLNNSIFKGLNESLNLYTLKAAQAFKTSDISYKLNEVNMIYELDNEENLIVKAKVGLLNDQTKLLNLSNNIEGSLNNIIFTTEKAQINLSNKDIHANTTTNVFYKNSTIQSDNFYSQKENNVLIFKGNVATTINLLDF